MTEQKYNDINFGKVGKLPDKQQPRYMLFGIARRTEIHDVGNIDCQCGECNWKKRYNTKSNLDPVYPIKCGCGGIIHANYIDISARGYTSYHTMCDKCHTSNTSLVLNDISRLILLFGDDPKELNLKSRRYILTERGANLKEIDEREGELKTGICRLIKEFEEKGGVFVESINYDINFKGIDYEKKMSVPQLTEIKVKLMI